MKSKQAILEYRMAPSGGRGRRRWGFRFKATDGRILMDSRGGFSSLSEAEQGFVSMVKSIASNKYLVDFPSKVLPVGRRRSSPRKVSA